MIKIQYHLPKEAEIGQKIDFIVTVNASKKDIIVSAPDKKSLEPLYFVSGIKIYQNKAYILKYNLRLFKFEDVTLPTQNIQVKTGSDVVSYEIPTQTLKIKTAIRNQKDLEQSLNHVRGLMSVPLSWGLYVGILAGLIVLAIALKLGLKKVESIQKKKNEKRKTPLEKAIEALEALPKEVSNKEELKKTYQEMSGIIKGYLSILVVEPLMEKTSREILVKIRPCVTADLFQKTKHVLQTSDAIKFAKKNITREAHETTIETTKGVLRAWAQELEGEKNHDV